MTLGNCLIGALYLCFKLGTWDIRVCRSRKKRHYYPHLYVVDKYGTKWHFKVIQDLLPYPFYWLWFKGRIEVML